MGLKNDYNYNDNFQYRDYFVVRITQSAQSRPSEYPGHGLLV